MEDDLKYLPTDPIERSWTLNVLLEQQTTKIQKLRLEMRRTRAAIQQKTYPDAMIIDDIHTRYDLSIAYHVSPADFNHALHAIEHNVHLLHALRCLKAMGAEMTVVGYPKEGVVFADTTDNVDVSAQELFLDQLDPEERSFAIGRLKKYCANIDWLLNKSHGKNGINCGDHLLLCAVSGAEAMPAHVYEELQCKKHIDHRTMSLLQTDPRSLAHGYAVHGCRHEDVAFVGEFDASQRFSFRAGRFWLRESTVICKSPSCFSLSHDALSP